MLTCSYNVDCITPHFYTVKLEFTGVYIIFLFSNTGYMPLNFNVTKLILLIPKQLAFLDINLSNHNDTVSIKIYVKWGDFDFDMVNFPFLDGDFPRRPSYGVYVSQRICFARASSHVTDFNSRTKFLTANSLSKAIGIINSAKHFPNFIEHTLN